ncbi:transporter substrate-binding domain-containing protein [Reinekea marina]|uniref:Substrate-binding periplasmic protein n=1 Tax=Reinekea marina TaxID=1310421 RepID=A0ABV7WRK6_9GAMM|nr:transporter substrate-binding domain-containing protein [Reinekea marina]MBU2864442.1 transporter substrate-binding domain-containing protein [Reinekea forsetii]MDN3647617.1 transporter substrate-binding domain-containing protein [Reinekea marina]
MAHYSNVQYFTRGYLATLLANVALASFVFSKEPQTLTCYSTTYEPYVFERDGKVVGIDSDAVREIGRRLNLDISIELKPWVRLERDIKQGIHDCAFAYFRTDERLTYMHFTNVPLHITSYTLFVNADQLRPFDSMEDIKGFQVAVNQGFQTTPEFEAAVKEELISEYRVREDSQAFKMLNAERVNAVLTNQVVGAYQAKQLGYNDIEPLKPPIRSTAAFLTFAKKDHLKPWVEKFDHAFFEILEDGSYQAIFDSYVSPKLAE